MQHALRFVLSSALALACAGGLFAKGAAEPAAGSGSAPLSLSMYYSDNSTLPFREDWLAVKTLSEKYNLKINWEIIPMGEYATKVSLALNSGNTPDVILYQSTSGENGSLALNGALYPVGDKPDWTPNFSRRIDEYGMKAELDEVRLKDGKLYYLPSLTDKPFYDGGLLLRQDLLEKYGITPTTWDDVYEFCKRYKAENPASYPFTVYYGLRVHYRMTQPAWGVSVGRNGPAGRVLFWDYDRKEFFPAAISEQYRDYLRFWHKMYAEGLLDPEYAEVIQDATWYRKLSTGAAVGTMGWYDQIGGIVGPSDVPGITFNLYPPPEGPDGPYSQPKGRLGGGIMFPTKASKRADFERIVRAMDNMFFSEEAAKVWCLGVEGVTYNTVGGKVQFVDSIRNSPDGIYKHMQIQYGCGSATTQMVWINAQEMTKYDDNYAAVNARVAAMGGIRTAPPTPKFDDNAAEETTQLMGTLWDAQTVWDDAFLSGKKSLDADWDSYVAEMKAKGIERYLALYNQFK